MVNKHITSMPGFNKYSKELRILRWGKPSANRQWAPTSFPGLLLSRRLTRKERRERKPWYRAINL